MAELQKAKVIDRPQIGLTEYWIVNIPEYCGKILVQRAGTTCPAHSHKKKHETFLVWQGKVKMVVDGKEIEMNPGDVLVMEQGKVHQFTAIGKDAIIFEFSGQHFEDDSYFTDHSMVKKAVGGAIEIKDYKWPFAPG
ncbi:cupin domain-containing protein [candidate division NPL-UPA2 bacterium]|nr:cupin domain-containing protein [candidate division NPL-UPA2 bacterium]